jgi:hypothetical protein
MQFYIEAKKFTHELGETWRGRALLMDKDAQIPFLLPLPENTPMARAEAAVAYELARILPSLVNPGQDLTLLVRAQETKDEIERSPIIMDLMGDVNVTIEVYDEDQSNED